MSLFTHLYMIYASLRVKQKNFEHLAYTLQKQTEMTSFRQNTSIFV